MQKQNK